MQGTLDVNNRSSAAFMSSAPIRRIDLCRVDGCWVGDYHIVLVWRGHEPPSDWLRTLTPPVLPQVAG